MKIAIDARLYGLENTGIGRYITNLVDGLQRQDRENSYFLLLNTKYYESLETKDNFTKIRVDIAHYSLREQLELPGILRKLQPDLVHFPHFNVPIFYRGPFVATIHDLLMNKHKGKDSTTHNALAYRYKRLGYRWVIKHAITRAEKVLVPTEFVKNDIAKSYAIKADKLVVTYEGIDKVFFEPPKASLVSRKNHIRKPYFIYTGNLYPHKNVDRAMEAVDLLNQQSEEKVQLVVVSARNFFTERLYEKVKTHSFGKYVKVVGFVPDRQLASLYLNSVGFVYPSLHEGFGLPGLEAMASGTLALVSDIPVFKEVYGKHASYFNPYDFTTISKAMKNALELEDARRKQKINSGQKWLARYSWENMVKETLEIYNALT